MADSLARVLAIILGKRIKAFRLARGLTQADLAERMGKPREFSPLIARIERGKHLPSIKKLEQLAAAMGVRCCDIVQALDSGVDWSKIRIER